MRDGVGGGGGERQAAARRNTGAEGRAAARDAATVSQMPESTGAKHSMQVRSGHACMHACTCYGRAVCVCVGGGGCVSVQVGSPAGAVQTAAHPPALIPTAVTACSEQACYNNDKAGACYAPPPRPAFFPLGPGLMMDLSVQVAQTHSAVILLGYEQWTCRSRLGGRALDRRMAARRPPAPGPGSKHERTSALSPSHHGPPDTHAGQDLQMMLQESIHLLATGGQLFEALLVLPLYDGLRPHRHTQVCVYDTIPAARCPEGLACLLRLRACAALCSGMEGWTAHVWGTHLVGPPCVRCV